MRLTLDPDVGAAWAVTGGRGAAIVLDGSPDSASADDRTVDLAGALGVAEVEVVVLRLPTPAPDDLTPEAALALLRQWVHQAAGGAGRGVALTVAGLPDGPLTLTVTSWDSSARELCLRLASPLEPALPALRSLLGTELTVIDGDLDSFAPTRPGSSPS
jgi:hypothetical protein